MKTNRELNTAHDAKQAEKVRPADPTYIWEPLQAVVNQWIRNAT